MNVQLKRTFLFSDKSVFLKYNGFLSSIYKLCKNALFTILTWPVNDFKKGNLHTFI